MDIAMKFTDWNYKDTAFSYAQVMGDAEGDLDQKIQSFIRAASVLSDVASDIAVSRLRLRTQFVPELYHAAEALLPNVGVSYAPYHARAIERIVRGIAYFDGAAHHCGRCARHYKPSGDNRQRPRSACAVGCGLRRVAAA